MNNWDLNDFSYYQKHLTDAIANMAKAFSDAMEAWDALDELDIPPDILDRATAVDEYPFKESFEEVGSDVVIWSAELRNYRDNKMPKVYEKLKRQIKDEED